MNDELLTAYCGLWCNDCIPSNERIYQLADELDKLLLETGFENYANFKVPKVPEYENYETFLSVLRALKKVQCKNYCRKGPVSEAGCAPDCVLRQCCIEKEIDGFFACEEVETCERIAAREGFHPGIRQNLTAMKEHGLKNWKDYRGRHYNWSKE